MNTIPVAMEFSPHDQLASGADTTTATEIEVKDLTKWPDPAGGLGIVVFCADEFRSKDPADYQIMTYTDKNGATSELEGLVHRAGTARSWAADTWVASYGTAFAWEQLRAVIGDLQDHVADTTTAHGAVSAATASKIMIRDASGRAQVASPSAGDDIANKTYADTMLPKAGGTMTGEIIVADQLLSRPKIKDYSEAAVIETGITGAKTIDLEAANYHSHTLSGATTYTVSNPAASGAACSFTLKVIQPATLYAITWFADITWAAGAAPTMALSKKYLMVFTTDDGGTSWLGALVGEF